MTVVLHVFGVRGMDSVWRLLNTRDRLPHLQTNDPIHRAAGKDVEYRADANGGSGAIACYAVRFVPACFQSPAYEFVILP
jgi:hypothetical protein